MNLTNYERETTINFNEDEKVADVYTHNKRLIKKLDSYCEKYPETCTKYNQTEDFACYTIPKKLVSIREPREPREITEEQREAARERMNKMHEKRKDAEKD